MAAVFIVSTSTGHASNCASISADIDARIRAAGVRDHRLSTVPVDARTPGKVVGTCDQGTKKIVYLRDTSPGPSASAAPQEPILTECRDGSTSVGGDCEE